MHGSEQLMTTCKMLGYAHTVLCMISGDDISDCRAWHGWPGAV